MGPPAGVPAQCAGVGRFGVVLFGLLGVVVVPLALQFRVVVVALLLAQLQQQALIALILQAHLLLKLHVPLLVLQVGRRLRLLLLLRWRRALRGRRFQEVALGRRLRPLLPLLAVFALRRG